MAADDHLDLCDCCGGVIDVDQRDTYMPTWSGGHLWLVCMTCAVRQRSIPMPPSLAKQVDAAQLGAEVTLDGSSSENGVQLSSASRERVRAAEASRPGGPPAQYLQHEGWIWLIAIVSALITGLAMGYLLGVHP